MNKLLLFLAIAVLLTGCTGQAEETEITECCLAIQTATETAEPTQTPEPTVTTGPSYSVIYDFQELHCQATWTNNGQTLACPANIYEEHPNGSVSLANESSMEGTQLIGDAALMTHPAENGSFYGIFGEYPPIQIVRGDEFRATIGCMDRVTEPEICDVQFALEYYDPNGNYTDSQPTGWFWNEVNDGVTQDIVVDLSVFAGHTIRLVLVVRDNGDPEGDVALWLHPQLWRRTGP